MRGTIGKKEKEFKWVLSEHPTLEECMVWNWSMMAFCAVNALHHIHSAAHFNITVHDVFDIPGTKIYEEALEKCQEMIDWLDKWKGEIDKYREKYGKPIE